MNTETNFKAARLLGHETVLRDGVVWVLKESTICPFEGKMVLDTTFDIFADTPQGAWWREQMVKALINLEYPVIIQASCGEYKITNFVGEFYGEYGVYYRTYEDAVAAAVNAVMGEG